MVAAGRPGQPRADPRDAGSAWLTMTGRSAGCTPMRPCSSAVCGRCSCSHCIPGDGGRRRALRLSRRSLGPAAADKHLPRGDDVRPAVDAQRAVDRVRGIHQRVHGIAPDGRPYHAADPHLLEWVHIAEVDSFLRAPTLRRATARPGRPRRVRGRHRPGGSSARRRRSAAHAERARRADRRVPSGCRAPRQRGMPPGICC